MSVRFPRALVLGGLCLAAAAGLSLQADASDEITSIAAAGRRGWTTPAGALQGAPTRVSGAAVRPAAPSPARLSTPGLSAPCAPLDPCAPVDPCAGTWVLSLAGGVAQATSPEGVVGVQPAPADSIDWGSLDYGAVPAARASLAWRAGARWGLRAGGTWWGRSDDDTTVAGSFASTEAPGVDLDISRPYNAALSTELTVWDGGVGLWMQWALGSSLTLTGSAGGRMARVDETARVDFSTVGPGGVPNAQGFAASDVTNELLLGELGFSLRWSPSTTWAFTLGASALAGSVSTSIDVSDATLFSAGSHASSRTKDDTTFGMQADLQVEWRFASRWALSAGYSLLWLDSVQRAAATMDYSQSATGAVQALYAPDSLTVHAVLLGVQFSF